MVVLNGVKNFLQFINDNWTMIAIIFALAIMVFKKAYAFFIKSDEEKLEIIKTQIRETMLKKVTEAEVNYSEWIKAGEIKRSQVIGQIYKDYPVLETIASQEELIVWLDEMIDEALKTMRNIFEENKEAVST